VQVSGAFESLQSWAVTLCSVGSATKFATNCEADDRPLTEGHRSRRMSDFANATSEASLGPPRWLVALAGVLRLIGGRGAVRRCPEGPRLREPPTG